MTVHILESITCYDMDRFLRMNNFFRHFQKGLRLDPEHGELKKAYFGLKNLLKKTKSVSPSNMKKYVKSYFLGSSILGWEGLFL